MPLNRDTVTVASRIMLPTYATVFGLIGALFLLQQPSRTSTGAFDAAKDLMPIRVWGIVFLAVAALELAALAVHNRRTYLGGLVIGAGLAVFWTVVLLTSAVHNPDVSFTSAVWVGGWVACHAATAKSLAERER